MRVVHLQFQLWDLAAQLQVMADVEEEVRPIKNSMEIGHLKDKLIMTICANEYYH